MKKMLYNFVGKQYYCFSTEEIKFRFGCDRVHQDESFMSADPNEVLLTSYIPLQRNLNWPIRHLTIIPGVNFFKEKLFRVPFPTQENFFCGSYRLQLAAWSYEFLVTSNNPFVIIWTIPVCGLINFTKYCSSVVYVSVANRKFLFI